MTRSHEGVADHATRALAAAVAAVLLLGTCWLVEVMNYADDDRLGMRYGIHARSPGSLWHIFTAPFLHVSLDHIMANSLPLVVLGFLAALRGLTRFAIVTLMIIVTSGLGVWLLAAPHSVTLGASGLIFGYFGYLLARGAFERRLFDIVVAAVVAVVYGTIVLGALPGQSGISWQAHLFGLVGGVYAAFVLRGRSISIATGR